MTNSRLIHVGNTRAGRKLFFRLEKERQKLLAAGFEPTPKLLAAKLDVDEKDLDRGEPAPGLARGLVRAARAGGAPRRACPLSERIAERRRSPESEAVERRDGRRGRAASSTRFRERLTDERERAVWIEHLAADEPRRWASWARASASPSSAWVRSPTA